MKIKKVIGGKLYNTETATVLAEYTSPHDAGDFHHYYEGLFRTPNGNLFLAGRGGARSKFASPVPGGTGGGEGLQPVGSDEALAWCESHDIDADIIREHFAVEEA